MLDAPQGVTDLNCVADPVLILEDDVKPGDDVAHQILRSEANREACESSDRRNRCDVDAELLNRSEQSDGPDDFISGAINLPRKRAGLLFSSLPRTSLRRGGLDDE